MSVTSQARGARRDAHRSTIASKSALRSRGTRKAASSSSRPPSSGEAAGSRRTASEAPSASSAKTASISERRRPASSRAASCSSFLRSRKALPEPCEPAARASAASTSRARASSRRTRIPHSTRPSTRSRTRSSRSRPSGPSGSPRRLASARSSEAKRVKSFIGSTAPAPAKCSMTASWARARSETQERSESRRWISSLPYWERGALAAISQSPPPASSARRGERPGSPGGAPASEGSRGLRTRQ